MTGPIEDLSTLLRTLRPMQHPGVCAYVVAPPGPLPPDVAGAHHDHLFVPAERAAEAVACLEALQRRAGAPPDPANAADAVGDASATVGASSATPRAR